VVPSAFGGDGGCGCVGLHCRSSKYFSSTLPAWQQEEEDEGREKVLLLLTCTVSSVPVVPKVFPAEEWGLG